MKPLKYKLKQSVWITVIGANGLIIPIEVRVIDLPSSASKYKDTNVYVLRDEFFRTKYFRRERIIFRTQTTAKNYLYRVGWPGWNKSIKE